MNADNSRYSFGALTDRKIAEDTARKYGVKVTYNYEGKVAEHMYPFYSENTLTATKIRTVSTKDFRWTGSATEVTIPSISRTGCITMDLIYFNSICSSNNYRF